MTLGRRAAVLAALVAIALQPSLVGAAPDPSAPSSARSSPDIARIPVDAFSQVIAPLPPDVPVALLVDVTTGQVLVSRDPDRRFVPASVAKAMTAYVAFTLIGEGKMHPDDQVVITPELLGGWHRKGSTLFLEVGDRISVEDLLTGITTVSANDASVVLARHMGGSIHGWTAMMNAEAAALGMDDSHFGLPNGWMDEGNTFTTAHDLAVLGDAMTRKYPNLYGRFFGQRGMRYNGFAQDNHEMLTGHVDGGDGIKTGYTRQAGLTLLGSAKRDGHRLMLVLAALEDTQVRNKTARDLIEWGFTALDRRRYFGKGQLVGTAEVQGGSAAQVALVAPKGVAAATTSGREARLTARIVYDGPLRAPIAAGQQVAVLRVRPAGMPPYDIPLVARDPVEKAGVLRRIGLGLAAWFA